MVRRDAQIKNALHTSLFVLWRLRYFDDNIRVGIRQPLVVCIGPRDFTVARLIVHSLDDRLWNRGTTWRKGSFATAGSNWTIACIHSGRASASLAFGDHFYFVRDSILESLVVRIRARDFAVARLVVDSLYAGGRYWRGCFRPLVLCGGAALAAFRCVGEVLVAFGCIWIMASEVDKKLPRIS
jgi:hypothetical protein